MLKVVSEILIRLQWTLFVVHKTAGKCLTGFNDFSLKF